MPSSPWQDQPSAFSADSARRGYILAVFVIGFPSVLLSDMRADRNCFNEGASRRDAERTVQAMVDAGIVSDAPEGDPTDDTPESEPAD